MLGTRTFVVKSETACAGRAVESSGLDGTSVAGGLMAESLAVSCISFDNTQQIPYVPFSKG